MGAWDREWLKRFIALLGGAAQPDAILDILEPHVATMRAAAIPVLMVSGGNNEAFELVSNQIAEQLDARQP